MLRNDEPQTLFPLPHSKLIELRIAPRALRHRVAGDQPQSIGRPQENGIASPSAIAHHRHHAANLASKNSFNTHNATIELQPGIDLFHRHQTGPHSHQHASRKSRHQRDRDHQLNQRKSFVLWGAGCGLQRRLQPTSACLNNHHGRTSPACKTPLRNPSSEKLCFTAPSIQSISSSIRSTSQVPGADPGTVSNGWITARHEQGIPPVRTASNSPTIGTLRCSFGSASSSSILDLASSTPRSYSVSRAAL